MARIERFEDIEAWKKARILVRRVYGVCSVEGFKRDYGLMDQMRRAAVSIMANIAEGFARRTTKEFINFLGMAHASAAELHSHLYVALDQQYISNEDFQHLYAPADEVSRMIPAFISYLRNSPTPKPTNSQTPKLPNSQLSNSPSERIE